MRHAAALMALSFLSAASGVSAKETPECRIRVLHPVTDDMGNHWQAGQTLPTTTMLRDKNGVAFCAHGGSCVPRRANGVQATQLVNCRPGRAIGDGYVALDPDPKTMSPATFRQMNTRTRAEQRLSALGFSNASAGSLAEAYAGSPTSADGRLVAEALAGSAEALAALRKRENP